MASIRRTLSPYNDRPYQNGGNLFSVESPTHKGKVPSPLLTLGFGVRRFVSVVFVQKQSRKGVNLWRRSLCWCLIFFCIGFLLGMAPFGEVEDIKGFEDRFVARSVENVEIEDRKDVAFLERPPENIGLDRVELGAVEMKYGEEGFDFVPRKQLILVTPTYNRALQAYFLNRLGQTLRLVPPPILWIVVEMNAASSETADILRKTGVMYRHLVCSKNLTNVKDRGVHQRNTALEHIERHKLDGIVYFADDDNIYSLELFEKMREISRFGTWPVAMLAQSKNKAILEGPVCNGSQVMGWHTNEKSKRLRRFHVDMSGFAFNSTILWDPRRWQRPTSDPIRQLDTAKEGFQETTFIEQVVEDENQMEGIPHSCSRIMNWHLHLEAHQLVYPRSWLLQRNLDVVIRT